MTSGEGRKKGTQLVTDETAALPRVVNNVMRACFFALPLLGLVCILSAPAIVLSAPPLRVDLRHDQTPLRKQGGRGTCIIHSVVAAMEAALNVGRTHCFWEKPRDRRSHRRGVRCCAKAPSAIRCPA